MLFKSWRRSISFRGPFMGKESAWLFLEPVIFTNFCPVSHMNCSASLTFHPLLKLVSAYLWSACRQRENIMCYDWACYRHLLLMTSVQKVCLTGSRCLWFAVAKWLNALLTQAICLRLRQFSTSPSKLTCVLHCGASVGPPKPVWYNWLLKLLTLRAGVFYTIMIYHLKAAFLLTLKSP